MPELPEVETVRAQLDPGLRGRLIESVWFSRQRLRHPVPIRAIERLVGHGFEEVGRRGKVLLIRLVPAGKTMIVHLGMSGRLLLETDQFPDDLPHEHVRLELDRGCLRFVDPRRFGSVELADTNDEEAHSRVARLGPEPLSDGFDGRYLWSVTRSRRIAIRDLLLQGNVVAGVGNIYANEACFRSGVRAQRRCHRLARSEAARLVDAVKTVLAEAIRLEGTTLRDKGWLTSGGSTGGFQRFLNVYGRNGQPCRSCGQPIRRHPSFRRSLFYCPRCQR